VPLEGHDSALVGSEVPKVITHPHTVQLKKNFLTLQVKYKLLINADI
jgi:hypothetical protein